jgi:hypothetical protein
MILNALYVCLLHSRFNENHPIRILEDGPLISVVALSHSSALESSPCILGVLFGSRAFLAMRWSMPGTILGEVASRCLYLATKPTHAGGRGREGRGR